MNFYKLVGLVLLGLMLSLSTADSQPALTTASRVQALEHSKVVLNGRTFTNVVHVYFESQIGDPESVFDIVKILDGATDQTLVVFHLSGVGGSVDTVLTLVDSIQNSRATTVMIAEGPVYSGHAYLATSGTYLIVEEYAYLMFHDTSALGVDCSKETGTDRGTPNSLHCQKALDTHIKNIHAFIDHNRYLTESEKELIEEGYDVYLTSDDIAARGVL